MIKQVGAHEPLVAMPEEWRRQQQELLAEGDRLYETFVKPLEAAHRGRFVAVSRDGRTLLGDNSREVLERAADAFGLENFLFKVGEKAVGKIR